MALPAPVKETIRLIQQARRHWDAHENKACRQVRERALSLYETLPPEQRKMVPETHRTWLRYRSEKYFGEHRTAPGSKPGRSKKQKPKAKKKDHAPKHATVWGQVESPVGPLILLASKKGLAGIYFNHRIEKSTLPKEHPENRILKKTAKQLAQYFEKKRESFDITLDAKGSAFQRDVWRQLSAIPFGETLAYGELARRLGNPKAVRAVGTANGANPISIIVPCHRVIGASGQLVGFGGGLEIKKKLLEMEGYFLPGLA